MTDPRLVRIEAGLLAEVAPRWRERVEAAVKLLSARLAAGGGEVSRFDVLDIVQRLELPAGVVDVGALAAAADVGDGRIPVDTPTTLDPVAAETLRRGGEKPGLAREEAGRRALALPAVVGGALALSALAPLTRSAAAVEGAVSDAVTRAANEAAYAAAKRTGERLVFDPERDACVVCLRYAGYTLGQLDGIRPPVHPHCRCELRHYTDAEVPRIIKREAVRSALRGFSLPSESNAARIRLAQRTLAGNPAAPESVKRYARAAVRRGEFARGRSVPRP